MTEDNLLFRMEKQIVDSIMELECQSVPKNFKIWGIAKNIRSFYSIF